MRSSPTDPTYVPAGQEAVGGRNRDRTCDPLLVRQPALNGVLTCGFTATRTSVRRKLWGH